MYFSNINYTIRYVDPSKSTNGDGLTIATAFNQLPTTDAGYVENILYLIRRTAEATAVTIPDMTCNRKNFVFMGMPKAEDWLYDVVPQEAKDAWGADTEEYANIKSTVYDGHFLMPNVQNFHLFRIYLYRSNIEPRQYIFYSENSSYNTQVSFQKCKFGALGVDLDDDNFTTAQTTYRACYFACFDYVRSFIVQDCIINFSCPNTGSYYGFKISYSYLINISNTTVNNVFQSSYYTNYPFYFDGRDSERPTTAYIENLTMNIALNNGYQYVPYLLYLRNPEFLRMKNINVGITKSLGTAHPTNLQLYNAIIYVYEAREYDIQDISIGLPAVWNVESGGACLNFESFYQRSRYPGNLQQVKNIYITMEEENGIDTAQGKYYDRAKYTSYSNYAVFRFSAYNSDDQRIPKFPILENINVYNIRGVAAYLYGCQIRDARFHGSVKMQYVVGDIETITSWYPAYQVFADDYTNVRIQSVITNQENESYPPAEEPVIYNSLNDYYFVYVDYCNCRLRPNTASTENRYNYISAICANEVENNHFSHRANNYICDTWTTARTGGAPVSLRMWNNYVNSTYPFTMGQEPFGGSKLTPTKLGENYVLVYGAFKGFSNPDDLSSKCVVQVSVPDGNGNYKRYFSNVNGLWLPDETSVWTGDNGLTQVILWMPIDVKTLAEQIDLKITYTWYSAAGYMYIDPAFKIYPADEIPTPLPEDSSTSSEVSVSSISSSSTGV